MVTSPLSRSWARAGWVSKKWFQSSKITIFTACLPEQRGRPVGPSGRPASLRLPQGRGCWAKLPRRLGSWLTQEVKIALLDRLGRLEQHRLGDAEPDGLGGLQIDDEVELGGPLDRQVGGLPTLEDLV